MTKDLTKSWKKMLNLLSTFNLYKIYVWLLELYDFESDLHIVICFIICRKLKNVSTTELKIALKIDLTNVAPNIANQLNSTY